MSFCPLRPAFACLAVLTLALSGSAVAQGLNRVHKPEPLRSADKAVRLYEAGQLRTLLSRCKREQTSGTWAQWEGTQASDRAWLLQYPADNSQNPRGAYARVLLDKRQAEWVDYQPVDGSQRLWLKPALPRDYARCRVVTNAQGEVRLEIVDRLQSFEMGLTQLWSSMPGASASCSQRAKGLRVTLSGEEAAWPLCTPAQQSWALEVEALTRDTFRMPVAR